MALDRWDELAQELWDLQRESLAPLVNVAETEDRVIVEVDLPLVRKEDIRLRLVEAGLEVEAALSRCVQYARWGTVQRRCEFRTLYRVVALPCPVVAEGATAAFKRGILRVELRKRRAADIRIPIT